VKNWPEHEHRKQKKLVDLAHEGETACVKKKLPFTGMAATERNRSQHVVKHQVMLIYKLACGY
jgi:hypothetical protein